MKKIYLFILLLSFSFGSKVVVGRLPIDYDSPIKVYRFYPNPASSFINFEFRNISESYTLQVYNFLGKKVFSQVVNGNKITIPVESFYRGLYIYQLKDAAGNIDESGKFQIVR